MCVCDATNCRVLFVHSVCWSVLQLFRTKCMPYPPKKKLVLSFPGCFVGRLKCWLNTHSRTHAEQSLSEICRGSVRKRGLVSQRVAKFVYRTWRRMVADKYMQIVHIPMYIWAAAGMAESNALIEMSDNYERFRFLLAVGGGC